MGRTGYDYPTPSPIEETDDVQVAIRASVFNYMQHQLGWSAAECEARVAMEEGREIPRRLIRELEAWGWNFEGARVLDLGAGQGGALVELLSRGADAEGVEPGPEFARVTRLRLEDAGHAIDRVKEASGESLPYPDGKFDYVISLQVLEHVRDPQPVLAEIYRVLKPGGECFISCENYLSFREQHYRLAWLPLLPKALGGLYLRFRGRDPRFLQKYVYYTTYPQIWRLCARLGFENRTYSSYTAKVRRPELARRAMVRSALQLAKHTAPGLAVGAVEAVNHLWNVLRVGVRFHLRKPV